MQELHRITQPDSETQTGICSICGPTRLKARGRLDVPKIYWRCYTKYNKNRKHRAFPYRQYKKDYCEKCGFIPEHQVQLDVDHIDGNNKNNELSNLQTLCANCHRLKTHLNQDNIKNKTA